MKHEPVVKTKNRCKRFTMDNFYAGCHFYGRMHVMENKKKAKRPAPAGILSMVKGYDIWIHGALIMLAFIGIVMIGSASMADAVGNSLSLVITIAKQFIFVATGYVLMSFLSRTFRLSDLKGNVFSLLTVLEIILLLVCIFFPGVNGSHAWIRIPLGITEVTIQPSEFAKILTFLIVAAHLADRNTPKAKWWDIVKRPVLITAIMAGIILALQSDFGSMLVLVIIFCVTYLIPRNRPLRRSQTVLVILFYVAVVMAILILSPAGESLIEKLPFLKDYQKGRFINAIDPFHDPYGGGYQIIQSLIAFADGGFFGRGLGQSVRKYMNFPEASTDFILAIYVEELGWVGFLFLILLYCIIIFRLIHYAKRIKSEAAKIILIGSATYFLVHIFFNIGGITGLIPLTGIPLPLLSSGGTSAVAFMMSIGLSQAVIAAYKRKELQ